MQNIENKLLDIFVDEKNAIKSHIPTANVLLKIDILTQQVVINESETPQCGRPVSF